MVLENQKYYRFRFNFLAFLLDGMTYVRDERQVDGTQHLRNCQTVTAKTDVRMRSQLPHLVQQNIDGFELVAFRVGSARVKE